VLKPLKWNGTTFRVSLFYGIFQERLDSALHQARLTGKHCSLVLNKYKPISALIRLFFLRRKMLNFGHLIRWMRFLGSMTHFYYGATYYSYSEDVGTVRLVRN